MERRERSRAQPELAVRSLQACAAEAALSPWGERIIGLKVSKVTDVLQYALLPMHASGKSGAIQLRVTSLWSLKESLEDLRSVSRFETFSSD